jgi:hypothetical protein
MTPGWSLVYHGRISHNLHDMCAIAGISYVVSERRFVYAVT